MHRSEQQYDEVKSQISFRNYFEFFFTLKPVVMGLSSLCTLFFSEVAVIGNLKVSLTQLPLKWQLFNMKALLHLKSSLNFRYGSCVRERLFSEDLALSGLFICPPKYPGSFKWLQERRGALAAAECCKILFQWLPTVGVRLRCRLSAPRDTCWMSEAESGPSLEMF